MIKIGIVGRPNVWKSTLFNKLIWTHRAIVTEVEGTTRDILYEKKNIEGKSVFFLDTPGLKPEDELQNIEEIIKWADLLIFVVDGKSWLSSVDQKIAAFIHKAGKKDKTLLVVNKLDGKDFYKFDLIAADFFGLGFENIKPLSLKTWNGINEVKDWVNHQVSKYFEKNTSSRDEEEEYIYLAIMGRPNVWKSTLFNRLVGENVAEVSEKAGTTLDYNKWEIHYKGNRFQLFDLMWVRRRGKISGLEKIALDKLQKMLHYVKPVVAVLIDLLEWVTHRDLTLLKEVFDNYKLPTIIVFNKYDAFEGDIKSKIRELGNFPAVLPLLTVSAKTGKNLHKLLELTKELQHKYLRHIPTHELNKLLRQKYLTSPPTFPKNKIVKIWYITQVWEAPPTFKIFVNRKDRVTTAFKRWIEKTLREAYDLKGIPIVLEFENK